MFPKTIRTAVKTVSWRVFAGIDTFVIAYLMATHLDNAAHAAMGIIGAEAATKFVWYYAHEKLWETTVINNLFTR